MGFNQQLMIGNLLDQTVDFPALKKHSWSPNNYEPHLVFSWNFILVLVLVVPPIFFMAFLHGTVWDIRGSHSGVSARREQVENQEAGKVSRKLSQRLLNSKGKSNLRETCLKQILHITHIIKYISLQ